MNADPRQARSIFLRAVEERRPEEWDAYLDENCGSDLALRERVYVLLQAHAESNSLLDAPAAALMATVDPQIGDRPIAEQPGDVIGHYKLLEQIGEGGFGVVFMAEQQAPVRRKAALKVLKPGMDTRQVVARFEAERQALALMDHPNIAHVFDGGTTETGRPYFVMELVRGVPITEFCDQSRMAIRERLELFVDVCQAVQHAHQKGIIHRDIKPTNVMVTLYDDRPVVKVIDFGIAKALGQQLTEKTLFTNFAQMIGTPLYMSPEQAAMSGLDIDTRGDIYSLGVLLYELLTGTTPFESERLSKVDYDEMRRIIREEEPHKPSVRISTIGKAATTVFETRQHDRRQLNRLFRAELDWIVMKALEKDRNRRYQTVIAFARDITCYLNDEQVFACPPSASYRLRKLARRYKAALGVAALLLFFLVLGGGGLGWAVRDRAAREADLATERATRRANLALEVEHALSEAEKAHGRSLALTSNSYQWEVALAEAASNMKRAEGLAAQDEVALEPKTRSRLKAVTSLIRAAQADRLFVARFEEVREAQAEVHLERGQFMKEVAFGALRDAFQRHYDLDFTKTPRERAAAVIQQRPQFVRQTLLAALEACLDHAPAGDHDVHAWLTAVLDLSDTGSWRRRTREALHAGDWHRIERLVEEAIVARQPPSLPLRLSGNAPEGSAIRLALARQIRQAYPSDFWANFDLASNLLFHSPPQFEEAIRYYTAALALRPHNPAACANLGHALRAIDDLRGAISVFREAIAWHPNYAAAHNRLALALEQQGDSQGAIAEMQACVALRSWVPAGLVVLLLKENRWDEAIALLDRDLELDLRDHERWYLSATLHASRNDPDGYRRVCHGMLERFGEAADVDSDVEAIEVMERTATVCLLLPGALDARDLERARMLADQAAGAAKRARPGFIATAKSLAEYRAAHHADAIAWIEQSPPNADGTPWDAMKFAVLAMASHRIGRLDAADAALGKAKSILTKMPEPRDWQLFDRRDASLAKRWQCWPPDPFKGWLHGAGNWHDWLHAQVLSREAEALLKTPTTESGS